MRRRFKGGDNMRTREEIEKREVTIGNRILNKDGKIEDLIHLILEVLLDIREQNEKDRIIFDDQGRSYTVRKKE